MALLQPQQSQVWGCQVCASPFRAGLRLSALRCSSLMLFGVAYYLYY